jgi:hypothetical protein
MADKRHRHSMDRKPYPLTVEHFQAFGAIVHQFARFEVLIGIIINQVLGGRKLSMTAIAISSLSYSQKSDALKTLLKIAIFPDNHNTVITGLISDFNAYSQLRNDIAHNIWREGKRHTSIKAVSVSSRGGKVKIRGISHDETDYTLGELTDIADNLTRIHDELRGFLEKVGAIPIMAEKIDDTKPGSKGSPESPPK